MSGRFLSESRFDEIRARLETGDTLTTEAHRLLMAAADKALQMDPLSVRQNGGSPFFRQDAAYVPNRDGVRNTEANHESRRLGGQFSQACMDLALAYRIGGDTRYADKALELIHCWCLNQNTRMFATGFVQDAATPGAGYGGDITIFATFDKAFRAMYLLKDYTGWDIHCLAAVRRWVRGMIEPQRELMFFDGTAMYNNWEDARLMYLASGAIFLDDADMLIEIFDRWKTIIPLKMTDEGQLPRETMRTRSMHYTIFALNSTITVAEIASGYGCDLYDYQTNGRCLKLAIDYAARYLLDMDKWPFQLLIPLDKDPLSLDLFELAYAHWGDQQYIDVMTKYSIRPCKDNHATLLFAKP